ncbi:Uncharacterized protein pbN1_27660 [Aromatoleum bremense]|nr:Uncharacterized protein pbN1_27660 [Aromatoleum bremense]
MRIIGEVCGIEPRRSLARARAAIQYAPCAICCILSSSSSSSLRSASRRTLPCAAAGNGSTIPARIEPGSAYA